MYTNTLNTLLKNIKMSIKHEVLYDVILPPLFAGHDDVWVPIETIILIIIIITTKINSFGRVKSWVVVVRDTEKKEINNANTIKYECSTYVLHHRLSRVREGRINFFLSAIVYNWKFTPDSNYYFLWLKYYFNDISAHLISGAGLVGICFSAKLICFTG